MKFPNQASNRNNFSIKETRNIGIAIGSPTGLSLGYTRDKMVSMPDDFHVYIEVFTDEQFEKAKKLILELEQIGIGVSYGSQNTHPATKK